MAVSQCCLIASVLADCECQGVRTRGPAPPNPQVGEDHLLAPFQGRQVHLNGVLSSLGECGNTATGRKIIAFSPKAAGNNFYFNGENRAPCISGRFTLQAVMSEKMSFF